MKTANRISHVIITLVGLMGVWLVMVEPINLGRLPQAAPSLSRSASSHVSLSRPYGLQSTIAGER